MLDILPQHAFLAVTLMHLQLNLRANIYEFIYHFIIIFLHTLSLLITILFCLFLLINVYLIPLHLLLHVLQIYMNINRYWCFQNSVINIFFNVVRLYSGSNRIPSTITTISCCSLLVAAEKKHSQGRRLSITSQGFFSHICRNSLVSPIQISIGMPIIQL